MLESGDDDRRRRTAALAGAAQQGVRRVQDALAHYSLEGDNVQAALEAMRVLLETDKVVLYSLEQHPDTDDLRVKRESNVGLARSTLRETFDAYLVGRGVAWGVYNAVRPEPAQRDRVLDSAQIDGLTRGRNREIEQVLYERLGLVGCDTMRVLVCDGPSLLAWLGIVQPEKTTSRQRELLELLLPSVRKRLRFDRMVSEAAVASGAVVAALEHVNGAAWLLGPGGRVEHANAAAQARLDGDRAATRAALDRCIAGNPEPRFSVTPLRDGSRRAGHVVVEAAERASSGGVMRAAARLGLTPAQTRVLERIARGVSNATIAAELKVAERTVEAHVTAILEKAQVPSRAALIVQIFA
jgi:DNA-binding CsgD family transcriptional regulator